MEYELFAVGGHVRDQFLGIESKDIDYTVVIKDIEKSENPYADFVKDIINKGFEVFLETPDCFTVRAKFPKDHQYSGLTADFVLARKELGYIDDTRTPVSTFGDLNDDLIRRDFTVNAIARDMEGNIIDPFGGREDLKKGVLRTPRAAVVTMKDDPLRILRAYRFSVTKSLRMHVNIKVAIKHLEPERMRVVSKERIREELFKMFKYDTKKSIEVLANLKDLNEELYNVVLENISFIPTLKKI